MKKKVSKEQLKRLVREAITSIMSEDGRLSNIEKERRERLRARVKNNARRRKKMLDTQGLEDVGITEKDELPCGSPNANAHHNAQGEWSSKEDATSWSITKKGPNCQSGQYKDKYKGPKREPCGRQDRSRKCKDTNEAELLSDSSDKYQELLYRYEKLQIDFKELEKMYHALKGKKARGKGMDLDQCIKTVNAVVQSGKGSFGKGKK